MNKNSENYKATYSALCPSNEATERALDLTTGKTRKTLKLKPVLAACFCLILLTVGVFGGSLIGGKASSNLFAIAAYADGGYINLKDTPFVKTDLRLFYADGDTGGFLVAADTVGFSFDGKNVSCVTYSAQYGDIEFITISENGVQFTEKEYRPSTEPQYGSSLTLEVGDGEKVVVGYYPAKAVDVMMSTDEKLDDLSVLPGDTIKVDVTFKDGSVASATINTSFDKEGNMLLKYAD